MTSSWVMTNASYLAQVISREQDRLSVVYPGYMIHDEIHETEVEPINDTFCPQKLAEKVKSCLKQRCDLHKQWAVHLLDLIQQTVQLCPCQFTWKMSIPGHLKIVAIQELMNNYQTVIMVELKASAFKDEVYCTINKRVGTEQPSPLLTSIQLAEERFTNNHHTFAFVILTKIQNELEHIPSCFEWNWSVSEDIQSSVVEKIIHDLQKELQISVKIIPDKLVICYVNEMMIK